MSLVQQQNWSGLKPDELRSILERSPRVHVANSVEQLFDMACGSRESNALEVAYHLPDGRLVPEVTVARVRNGIAVNYVDPYMRRRDPDCMVLGDLQPTDKTHYSERFHADFQTLRQETLDWLATQELAIFAFHTGQQRKGTEALAVVPVNAAFFALGLALLQGIVSYQDLGEDFAPRTVIYVAPPFRHTHFDGKQVVVHNRLPEVHEIFSFNLYPGPSAKKGVYGSLIQQASKEGWVVAHCSAVQVVTPYDNTLTIMHEGASGGGKSEMLEQPHRLGDGRMRKGRNVVTGEERFVEIPRTCDLRPVCDDMGLCHPGIQRNDGRLWLEDAEEGWFVRVNHIHEYGVDHDLEKLTVHPPTPLVFLNIDAVPQSRALIWEHIQDKPGVSCPNPRVIIPRSIVPNVMNEPVGVDVRSFGIRTPVCTRENPSYGILGLFHVLPPALAWLWRLVAPRGHANPSITDGGALASEGVGSYWPFATGKKIEQANLLLRQIAQTLRTRHVLIPNQHVGAWETGFMPEWLARDYLARRGSAKFKEGQIKPARCSLLGYALQSMRIEGVQISNWFLEVNTQPEVGNDGYDAGAAILRKFFHEQIRGFLENDLDPLGRQIIECCLEDGGVEDYLRLMPTQEL